ncbi:MAG: DUF1854 domain-containing protein [Planctomycetes bacterium]|nr:DUF1854 domain-containing protein [Planctomycetota bacterium]
MNSEKKKDIKGVSIRGFAGEKSLDHILLLDPSKISFLRQGALLRMTLTGERSLLKVTAHCSFPLSNRRQYISIKDGAGEEVGMIADLGQLDLSDRQRLEEELKRRYVMPEVRKILALNERFGIEDWEFETDRGYRKVSIRHLRDNLVTSPSGALIITDVEGNRFEIKDPESLDFKSQRLLYSRM